MYLLITGDDIIEISALNVPPHIRSTQLALASVKGLPIFEAHGIPTQSAEHELGVGPLPTID